MRICANFDIKGVKNEKLTNRDIDFENEECMKVNENYWNNIIS